LALNSIGDVWLDFRLLLRRTGYVRLLAAALLFCAGLVHFVVTPLLDKKAEALRQKADALRRAPVSTDLQSLQQERYQSFLDRLPPMEERPAVLKTVFEASNSSGIVLSQAEYQLQRNELGRYYRLRMSIPVTASYLKLRTLLDTVLEQTPSASIDEISLHRETVNNPTVSANLKLSIYFKEAN